MPWQAHPGRGRLRRPQQRARHLGRLGRQRARRPRPGRATTSSRSASRPSGQWVLTDADPAALRITGRTLPEVEKGTRSSCRPTRRRRRWSRVEPGAGGRRRSSRSTSSSRCCTAASARTARSRGCSRWPACPTSAPGVFASAAAMDKEFTKNLLRAAGLDGRRVRGAAPRPAVLGRPTCTTSACRCSSSRPAPGPASASRKVDRLGRASPTPSRSRSRHDTKVLVEAAVAGREIECGVLENDDGCPRPACRPRSGCVRGHDWYDFDAKYLDDACEFDIPAQLPAERDRRGPATPPAAPSPRSTAPAWPASTSSSPTDDAGRRQRDQHDARVHPDLDVSRGCGPPPASTTRRWSTG